MTDREVEIAVKGMDCEQCEITLSEFLEELDGVLDARPDHKAESVMVKYDDERVQLSAIRDQIEAAGYEPR